MPLPVCCDLASVLGPCALTQTVVMKKKNKTAVNREMLVVGDIDLKIFQQGTFGPGEMLKMRVAEETPVAKN